MSSAYAPLDLRVRYGSRVTHYNSISIIGLSKGSFDRIVIPGKEMLAPEFGLFPSRPPRYREQ